MEQQEDKNLFCSDLPTIPRPEIGLILVSGASGYIGGRLVPELLARGYRVRVMVRADSPDYIERWPGAEIHVADALDSDGLSKTLQGVHTAYYLIHSMLLGEKKFEAADINAAVNFRQAAELNNINQIIYLGGLGDINTRLSPHLLSRMKVAEELQKGAVPVTILRAAIIIGSGSASFEIIKNLVKKFPVLFAPRWARTKCQPIAIRDVIKYLVGLLELDVTKDDCFDIGGVDVLRYRDMMKILADILGKKRLFIPLPFSMARLYAYLTSFFTPVPARITMCLMGGCSNEVVCQNTDITKILTFNRLSYRESIIRAMTREEQDSVRTRWSDAYPPAHELAIKLHELPSPPGYTSTYSLCTPKDNTALFKNICMIGGKHGWFNSNILWRLRGMIDRIFLGVGTSRGRRSYSNLRINDVIDFWRVEDLKPGRMLLLRAEMILPGKAWLKFNIDSMDQKNILSVTAYFDARGLFGKIYWYIFLPFHHFIFYDIIHQVEQRS
jgi:uncharacterized protein YbjT (DUF2867 family)